MAVNYTDNRVTATSNSAVMKLKSVRFAANEVTTGGANSVKAVIPPAATLIGFRFWKRTQLTGGGITAATLSIGVPGNPTAYVNAADILTPAAGVTVFLISTTTHNSYEPNAGDISLLFTGTATTGNPTAGEFFVDILYAE
jgi:hypothetical protein